VVEPAETTIYSVVVISTSSLARYETKLLDSPILYGGGAGA